MAEQFRSLGRVEFPKNNKEPLKSNHGMCTFVDIYKDYVVKYLHPDDVTRTKILFLSAKEKDLDDLLNPILESGKYYTKSPRCEHVTAQNLPDDWHATLQKMKALKDIGIYDLTSNNVMVCDGNLKVTDLGLPGNGSRWPTPALRSDEYGPCYVPYLSQSEIDHYRRSADKVVQKTQEEFQQLSDDPDL